MGFSKRSEDLTTSKCLWNITISTEGAKYMCLDIKNVYLGTPMDSFEYMHIPVKLVPQEIFAEYNLISLVLDGHIYIEVQKRMYGLPQAGILANQILARRLAVHGYHHTKFTPDIWRHLTRTIQFTLVVDDFGVQYVGQERVQHLIAYLEKRLYSFKVMDWRPLLLYYFTLGVRKQACGPFNARLYQGCPAQVSSPHAKEATICPSSWCPLPLAAL
jgi:hypothetical protein